MPETETKKLYRVENPAIPVDPRRFGHVSDPEIIGQWFTPDVDAAMNYAPKSTRRFGGKNAGPVDGAQLVVAQVTPEKLADFHVRKHPIASQLDHEIDNYIVPRDGTVPTTTVPLDDILGDLRGELGDFFKLSEAKRLVVLHLGELGLL